MGKKSTNRYLKIRVWIRDDKYISDPLITKCNNTSYKFTYLPCCTQEDLIRLKIMPDMSKVEEEKKGGQ